jgi:hypothetical protein
VNLRNLVAACAALMLAACDESAPDVTFDGARAFEYVRLQVAAGPRVPGSESHRLVGDRIIAELRKTADTVMEQTWMHTTQKGDSLPMRNIFAQFNPSAARRILYVTHYDTRPTAESSFSIDDRTKPIPGANDGASGVALLLVLAEALKAEPATIGVDLLFTDGEDYGEFRGVESDTSATSDVLIGARYFANNLLPGPDYSPEFGILWDMVGGKDLLIRREAFSEVAARDVNDRIWKMARALGYSREFIDDIIQVTDDHIPLLGKGLKVVDVIDMSYPQHHQVSDGLENVSAASLTIVGRVALAMIRDAERD